MTETKTRGWGTPAFITFVGIILALVVAWATLSILIELIGPKAAAFVFILLVIAFVLGMGTGFLAFVISKSIQKDKPVTMPMPTSAGYQIVDAANATLPMVTNNKWLSPKAPVSTFVLEFGNRKVTVPMEAVYKILSMEVVTRTADWAWANETYGDIKDYMVLRGWLYVQHPQAAGLWINRAAAIASVQSWATRPA